MKAFKYVSKCVLLSVLASAGVALVLLGLGSFVVWIVPEWFQVLTIARWAIGFGVLTGLVWGLGTAAHDRIYRWW